MYLSTKNVLIDGKPEDLIAFFHKCDRNYIKKTELVLGGITSYGIIDLKYGYPRTLTFSISKEDDKNCVYVAVAAITPDKSTSDDFIDKFLARAITALENPKALPTEEFQYN